MGGVNGGGFEQSSSWISLLEITRILEVERNAIKKICSNLLVILAAFLRSAEKFFRESSALSRHASGCIINCKNLKLGSKRWQHTFRCTNPISNDEVTRFRILCGRSGSNLSVHVWTSGHFIVYSSSPKAPFKACDPCSA